MTTGVNKRRIPLCYNANCLIGSTVGAPEDRRFFPYKEEVGGSKPSTPTGGIPCSQRGSTCSQVVGSFRRRRGRRRLARRAPRANNDWSGVAVWDSRRSDGPCSSRCDVFLPPLGGVTAEGGEGGYEARSGPAGHLPQEGRKREEATGPTPSPGTPHTEHTTGTKAARCSSSTGRRGAGSPIVRRLDFVLRSASFRYRHRLVLTIQGSLHCLRCQKLITRSCDAIKSARSSAPANSALMAAKSTSATSRAPAQGSQTYIGTLAPMI
jgi:hypothetical protein